MERQPMEKEKEKTKIKTFKDLYAWKESHALVLLTYTVTKKFPREEAFALTSQMKRAAISITSNIAEGFGRNSYKEKTQFYFIAKGSAIELQNQFIIARDIGYLSLQEFEQACAQSLRAQRIIQGLIKGSRAFS